MSDTKHLVYEGIHHEVIIPDLGNATLPRGDVLEVAAAVAGEPPKGESLGEGLLAQVGNWRLATKAEISKAAPAEAA